MSNDAKLSPDKKLTWWDRLVCALRGHRGVGFVMGRAYCKHCGGKVHL